jgi:hypothetical protein
MAAYNASKNSDIVTIVGNQNFVKGGKITVDYLGPERIAFKISAKAKGITQG